MLKNNLFICYVVTFVTGVLSLYKATFHTQENESKSVY